MPTVNLLYKKQYPITDGISIRIPTVGDVIDYEDEYYSMVFSLTAMPIDMMVQLDDAGVDFTKINEYELFILLFNGLKETPSAGLIFGDLDIKGFEVMMDVNGSIVLRNRETGVEINRAIYNEIATAIRKIHNLEKRIQRPGNEAAKKYMIERARVKQRRAAKQKSYSELEDLIVAMVNTKEFKYDYEGVLDISIYQFNASVQQIVKKVNYDNLMIGCYAGTVDIKKLDQDSFNWLSNDRRKNQ